MDDEVTRGMDGSTAGRAASVVAFPPFRINTINKQLWRGARLVPLKPKAFAVLCYLAERPQQLVSKQELLAQFWGTVHVSEGVLKTHLGEIRQALGDRARAPRFIETAHRLGYRFIGRIEGAPRADANAASSSIAAAGGVLRRAGPSLDFSHFVGRAPELRILEERWLRALGGERQSIFITGEPGVGKTMLVNAFLEQLRSEGNVWVAWGQCVDQYGPGEPYLPFLEALSRLCRQRGGKLLPAMLRQHAPVWFAQMPGFTDADLSTPSPKIDGPTPQRMLRELAEALEMLTERQPLVLLLEDVHWADYSTLDAIAYLAQRSDPARLLLLATYRPVEIVGQHRLASIDRDLTSRGRSVELPVSPLNERSIAEYLDYRFPANDFSAALAQLIRGRTEGNALFMVKVIDGWLERDLLPSTSGRCELTASLEELSRCVPNSLVRMIERDLDALNAFEFSVLEAASVAGNEFSTATVAAALAEDNERIEEVCTRWARRGRFLKINGRSEWNDGVLAERCEFIHVLYQQVAYQQIGAARQARLHRRIGEWLEAAYAHDAGSIAAALANHFQRGQDHRRAVQYLRLAGEQALARSAYHEAVGHFHLALEVLRNLPHDLEKNRLELELCLALGPPLSATKGYAAREVEEVYGRAKDLCEVLGEAGQHLPLMAASGTFYMLHGAHLKWLDLGGELLELAENKGDTVAIGQASLLRGMSYHHLGEHTMASAQLERAIAVYEPSERHIHTSLYFHDPAIVARCFLSASACMLGYPARALRDVQNALRLAEQSKDLFASAFALNFGAYVHQLRRESDEAAQCAEALAVLSSGQRFAFWLAQATCLLGQSKVQQGELEAGISMLQGGWRELKDMGVVAYATYWSSVLAEAYGKLGQFEKAFEKLSEALPGGSYADEAFWEAELYRIAGDLLFKAESTQKSVKGMRVPSNVFPSAEGCLQRALIIAKQQRAKLLELRAATSLARYWQAQGRVAEARALLIPVYGWFSEGLNMVDLMVARALISELTQSPYSGARPAS